MFHLLYNDPYLLEVLGVNPTHKMAVVVFVCVCVCVINYCDSLPSIRRFLFVIYMQGTRCSVVYDIYFGVEFSYVYV
jgi:hypothetical protein